MVTFNEMFYRVNHGHLLLLHQLKIIYPVAIIIIIIKENYSHYSDIFGTKFLGLISDVFMLQFHDPQKIYFVDRLIINPHSFHDDNDPLTAFYNQVTLESAHA